MGGLPRVGAVCISLAKLSHDHVAATTSVEGSGNGTCRSGTTAGPGVRWVAIPLAVLRDGSFASIAFNTIVGLANGPRATIVLVAAVALAHGPGATGGLVAIVALAYRARATIGLVAAVLLAYGPGATITHVATVGLGLLSVLALPDSR